MAVLITSKSDGPINLPSYYGNNVIAPKGSIIIQDTLANVQAVLPGAPTVWQFSTVADGQSGAVTPARLTPEYAALGTSATPEQLTVQQSGSTVSDNATAKAYETLPAYAAGLVGLKFRFVTLNDGFRILPAAADTITVGSSTTTASTGHIDNATAGNQIELELVSANKWVATLTTGTWTVT